MATYGTYDCNITNKTLQVNSSSSISGTISTQLSPNTIGTIIEKPIYTYSYISNNYISIDNTYYEDKYYAEYSNLGYLKQSTNPKLYQLNVGTVLYMLHPEKGRIFYVVRSLESAKEYEESNIPIASNKENFDNDKFGEKSLYDIIRNENIKGKNKVYLEAIIPTCADIMQYNDITPIGNSMVLYVFSDKRINSHVDNTHNGSKFNIHSRLEITAVYSKNNLIKNGGIVVALNTLDYLVYKGEPSVNVSLVNEPNLKHDMFVSSGSNFTVNLQTETKRQFILNLAKELYVATAFDMNPDKSLSSFALDAITRAKEFYKIASASKIDENGKNVSLI